jgi:hypothetical protein
MLREAALAGSVVESRRLDGWGKVMEGGGLRTQAPAAASNKLVPSLGEVDQC